MSVFIGDTISLERYRVTPPRIWKRWIHRVEEKGDGDQGMGMDQESMCVWTLRTSPSAVVGFNPHSSFPSSFSSLLT